MNQKNSVILREQGDRRIPHACAQSRIRERSFTAFRMTMGRFFILLVVVTLAMVSVFPALAVAVDEEIGARAVSERLQRSGEQGAGFPAFAGEPAGYFGRIVRGALVLLGLVFFTLTVYGGFLYLTASGNEDQVKKAKTILTRAIIGLIIVIFAGAITQFITGYVARPVEVR